MIVLTVDELPRFWAKVDKSQECWFWTAYTTPKGYGMFRTRSGVRSTHRISYELHCGEIPGHLFVDHTCHVRNCVNPAHLRLLTPKQNGENRSGVGKLNRSGVRGVCWAKRHRKWLGLVGHAGKQHFAGYHDTVEQAEKAVIALRNTLHTHNDLDRIGAKS